MRRLLLVGMMAAGAAWGQCTLWNQASCGSVYALNGGVLPSGSPTLASFLSSAWANFQAIDAAVARLPQPKIALAAQNWPCAGEVLSGAVTSFGPQCKPYAILLQNAGLTTQDYFVWQAAMASSAEYQALGVTGPYNIPGDCVDNAGAPYLTYGETPGAGSGNHCWALYYYDQTFAYLHNNGLTLRTGTSTMTDFLLACGLTPGGSLASPNFTEAQYESCVLPLQKAEVSRWSHIRAMQVFQEPTAGMAAEQVFSVADVSTFIQHASAALKAINGSLQIGASGTGLSYPQSFDNAYWADWTNQAGSTFPALDFLVIDLFSGSCALGVSNTQFPGQFYYAAELANWAGPFNPASGQYGYIGQAKATGKPVRIGQSDAPMWCPTTGHAGQANAILGSDDVVWDASGLFNTWLAAVVPWASAMGLDSMSIYGSLPLFYWSSNQNDDNPFTETGGAAMANLAATDSAATYKILAKWSAESMQGNAHLSGHAHLGR